MKNNPGREIFGKQHPYFKVPRGFKADKANNFGLPDPPPITNDEIVKNIKEAQKKVSKKIELKGFSGSWEYGKLKGNQLKTQKNIENFTGFKIPDKLIKKAGIIKPRDSKDAYFMPQTKTLAIANKGQDWKDAKSFKFKTTAHEIGHAIDKNLGIIKNGIPSPEFATVAKTLSKEINKKGLKSFDLKLKKDADNYQNLFYKAKAIKDTKNINKYGELLDQVSAVRDSLGDISRGNFGAGHSKAYYNKYRLQELFAHSSENYFCGNAYFEKELPLTFLESKNFFKNLLK